MYKYIYFSALMALFVPLIPGIGILLTVIFVIFAAVVAIALIYVMKRKREKEQEPEGLQRQDPHEDQNSLHSDNQEPDEPTDVELGEAGKSAALSKRPANERSLTQFERIEKIKSESGIQESPLDAKCNALVSTS